MTLTHRLYVAVCWVLLATALSGCSPAPSPEEVARTFVQAVLEGNTQTASAIASQPLDRDQLRDFRVQMTGEAVVRRNVKVDLFASTTDQDSALFDLVSVKAEPAPDARQVNERGFSVQLQNKGSRWLVLIDPSALE